MKSNDAFTIIHTAPGAPPKTVATGLSRDEALRWLAAKAAETGSILSRDLTIPKSADRDETWQAVQAE